MHYRLIITLTSLLCCLPIHGRFSKNSAQRMLDQLYNGANGFIITDQDRSLFEPYGFAMSTYGEILYDSFATLLKDLKLTSRDILWDLGCGVGKACMQVVLTTPARAVGIELSPTRITHAHNAHQQLATRHPKIAKRVRFLRQDVVKSCFDQPTVIFWCSTCFPDDAMRHVTQNIARQGKQGLRVITLKKLPEPDDKAFTLKKQYNLPMSWSPSSPVYLYEKN